MFFGDPDNVEVEVIEGQPMRLGVTLGEVSDAVASQMGLDKGKVVLITGVVEGMPAEKAGLKRFDIIAGIDDHKAVTPETLREVVFSRKPGDEVTLWVIRKGDKKKFNVRLADGGGRGPVVIDRLRSDANRGQAELHRRELSELQEKLRAMRGAERDAVRERQRVVEREMRDVEREADARRRALDRLRAESGQQGGQMRWRAEQYEDVRKQMAEQLRGLEGKIDAETKRSIEEAMARVRESMKDLDMDLPQIEIYRGDGRHEALILPPSGSGRGGAPSWTPRAPAGGAGANRMAPDRSDERNRNLHDRLNGLEDRMDRIERLLERILEQRG